MPMNVSVGVKIPANNRSGNIRCAVNRQVSRGSVEHAGKTCTRSTGGVQVDSLLHIRIGRADPIELQVPGEPALVDDVCSLRPEIAVEEHLEMYMLRNHDRRTDAGGAADVAGHVNCDIGFLRYPV